MPLYPRTFIDDVKLQADIVVVVQDTVPLRRVGGTYKGLCPFHDEKTPSFHVNRERGFFHCFGCGVGGDVFKFVELRDKVEFGEAVRHLAERFGITLPAVREGHQDPAFELEREGLLKIHEVAAAWFRAQLESPAGERARSQLAGRGLTADTTSALGLGFAPRSRDALMTALARQGFSRALVLKSGLVVERDQGELVDRFRNRLMVPICRESKAVVAFGGRAMDAEQVPKYLNSPETPIYTKGRTLYGLHLSKSAIRHTGVAVIVEGYFDFAQAWQAGIEHVVATCGTALSASQAQILRRFSNRVVLSFDADTAGQGAAVKSCQLLVEQGFQVGVVVLPAGEDPDTFVRRHGGEAYRETLAASRPYLEYLLDREAAGHDFANSDSRRDFVHRMLEVAARIPEATVRDQFADRLAHKARIGEDVVRAEIRKAAVARRTTVSRRELPGSRDLKPAERLLLAALVRDPGDAVRALGTMEEADFEGLASGRMLRIAREFEREPPEAIPGRLLERLNEDEVRWLTALAAGAEAPAPPAECVRALRVLRYQRERADVQRELDRLQETGGADAPMIDVLLQRKGELLVRLEALNT
jgi:DNA primase